jgi:hypothetical protein
MYSLISGY